MVPISYKARQIMLNRKNLNSLSSDRIGVEINRKLKYGEKLFFFKKKNKKYGIFPSIVNGV